jgi:hypothetical protein
VPWGCEISSTLITLRFPDMSEVLPRFAAQLIPIKRRRRAAGLALIPQLLEALYVLLAKLAFELPVLQRFADNLAGGRILAALDGSLECGDLFAGQGDADLLGIAHGASPILAW